MFVVLIIKFRNGMFLFYFNFDLSTLQEGEEEKKSYTGHLQCTVNQHQVNDDSEKKNLMLALKINISNDIYTIINEKNDDFQN